MLRLLLGHDQVGFTDRWYHTGGQKVFWSYFLVPDPATTTENSTTSSTKTGPATATTGPATTPPNTVQLSTGSFVGIAVGVGVVVILIILVTALVTAMIIGYGKRKRAESIKTTPSEAYHVPPTGYFSPQDQARKDELQDVSAEQESTHSDNGYEEVDMQVYYNQSYGTQD